MRRSGWVLACAAGLAAGCKSPATYRAEADRAAYGIIDEKRAALGREEPFTIERPEETLRKRLLIDQGLQTSHPASYGAEHAPAIKHLPEDVAAGVPVPAAAAPSRAPVRLTLVDALRAGAANSREYQTQKEQVFLAALRLDLERDEFRTTFQGLISGDVIADFSGDDTAGVVVSPQVSASRRFYNGMLFSARLAVDVAKLLTGGSGSSLGIQGDLSVTIPLLRGAGRHIVTEPLTQAERDVVYAIYEFETFKRNFAVNVATQYLGVLQQLDQVANAEENYRNLIASTRRARRLAEAGRLDQVQVDQSVQQELNARERWISTLDAYRQRLDQFKELLGLPTDAVVELDRSELERLRGIYDAINVGPETVSMADVPPADTPIELPPPGAGKPGPLEMAEERAVRLALENRLDLRVAQGEVFDAQRQVVVAADALRAGLEVTGGASFGERRASIGSAALPDAQLRIDEGVWTAGGLLDLPLERTAERNAYRISLINLERAARNLQQVEDRIKLDVRTTLGDLLQSRESLLNQAAALALAQRRVASTTLFLEAGRVQIRDLLDAQEDLVAAQNAFTSALISYRLGELELQRDLGVLEVSETGLWREFDPQENAP